ncbi:hypothetical protein BT67DRAFT_87080 [Trichocladium antarcticum]|uniref:Uncharacterized protein n=1 Tax=Trichocladium antarcticum TaxID=1450529 RepID=A0AAN6UGB1_9PEZI|nr:hypothetical protein BT67DRAFT_87080 [Trichocladium antarcticum]
MTLACFVEFPHEDQPVTRTGRASRQAPAPESSWLDWALALSGSISLLAPFPRTAVSVHLNCPTSQQVNTSSESRQESGLCGTFSSCNVHHTFPGTWLGPLRNIGRRSNPAVWGDNRRVHAMDDNNPSGDVPQKRNLKVAAAQNQQSRPDRTHVLGRAQLPLNRLYFPASQPMLYVSRPENGMQSAETWWEIA